MLVGHRWKRTSYSRDSELGAMVVAERPLPAMVPQQVSTKSLDRTFYRTQPPKTAILIALQQTHQTHNKAEAPTNQMTPNVTGTPTLKAAFILNLSRSVNTLKHSIEAAHGNCSLSRALAEPSASRVLGPFGIARSPYSACLPYTSP